MTSRPGPDPAQRIMLGLCVRGAMPHLRRREEHLASLCADDILDVLDGAVLHQPDDPRLAVRFRELQNLPRVAALPDPLWATICDTLGARPSTVTHPHPRSPDIRSPDVLVADTRSLVNVVNLLVAFAEPVAPGESVLVAFLNAPTALDDRRLAKNQTSFAAGTHPWPLDPERVTPAGTPRSHLLCSTCTAPTTSTLPTTRTEERP